MIFTDLDNTIAQSSKAFIQVYSEMFNVKPIKSDTLKWDFSDCFNEPIPQHTILDIFGCKRFYEVLEPVKDAVGVLKELRKEHKIYIVSIASPSSSKRKIDWCYENFPFANFIPVISHDFDKSIIQMQGNTYSYIIDDRIDCLNSSNADCKIMFEIEGANWQTSYNGIKYNNWKDIQKFIKGEM